MLDICMYICTFHCLLMYRLPLLMYPEGISGERAAFCLALKICWWKHICILKHMRSSSHHKKEKRVKEADEEWKQRMKWHWRSKAHVEKTIFLCKHLCKMWQNDKFQISVCAMVISHNCEINLIILCEFIQNLCFNSKL